jgi:hypothetical protein
MRETGIEGAEHGTREEEYAGADFVSVAIASRLVESCIAIPIDFITLSALSRVG